MLDEGALVAGSSIRSPGSWSAAGPTRPTPRRWQTRAAARDPATGHRETCHSRAVVRFFLLCLAVAGTAATAAHAQPASEAGLTWHAPTACPGADEVRARIERRLGAPLDQLVHGVEVAITVDDGERRFVARIDLRAVTVANEVRTLTSARCDELTDAVAVVIARIAAERRQLPAARAERTAEVLAPAAESPRLWGAGFRALGMSGVGATPGIGVAGEVAVFARRGSTFVELALARWMRSPRYLYMGSSGRIDIGLGVTIARVGWGPENMPLRGWLSAELGSLEGQGATFQSDVARWVGVGGGFGVAWPMTPRTRLVGVVEAVVPLQRGRFMLTYGHEVYRPDIASARCGFGLEVGWR
jgi:hypothetical protein